ncbi:MAG: DoxX family protein [Bacteroidia bacterium]
MNKTTNIIFWVVTGLLGLFMVASGLGSVTGAEQVVQSVTGLGYPAYFIPFLGVMKILGGLTIVFIKIPQIKIGAYAGAYFWNVGALYSHIAHGDAIADFAPMILAFILISASFYLWNKHTFSPKLAA